MRHLSPFDSVLGKVDEWLRARSQNKFNKLSLTKADKTLIQQQPEDSLSSLEKKQSISLMRINHSGEVCAQALYHAQSLMARDHNLVQSFKKAAAEEEQHLEWCKVRIAALGGRTSFLNPLWYGGSFMIGCLAGMAGDKISLGFLAETEHQVVNHLERHLRALPPNDKTSKHILEKMKEDELEHATHALNEGGVELPFPIPFLMKISSKVMTTLTRYL